MCMYANRNQVAPASAYIRPNISLLKVFVVRCVQAAQSATHVTCSTGRILDFFKNGFCPLIVLKDLPQNEGLA